LLDSYLEQLALDPAADIDLAAVALYLAADEYPDLDVPAYLDRLADLAERVRPHLGGSLEETVAGLCQFLFEEEGYLGNTDHYYDPRNSYLNEVMDRKLGIPITLSVVAVAVGTRAVNVVAGARLPGHFVAKASDPSGHNIFFDPFNGGQFLDAAGVRNSCQR